MEKIDIMDQSSIINVLLQGREHTNELKCQLESITSREDFVSKVEKILSAYDNALALLNCMALLGQPTQVESPNMILVDSPRSEVSDRGSSDQTRKEVHKKRKTLPKWSEQVRICSGTGVDIPVDDGYSWRKYGQKEILRAKHPRAYYRCTHRHSQGCLATKQVQRTDEDPSVFEVSYRGKHSCMVEKLKQNKENVLQTIKQENQSQKKQCVELVHKVQNHQSDTMTEPFLSFSFPMTPIDSDNLETEFFPETLKESSFTECQSPFISPATPESYFSACHVNDFAINQDLQHLDCSFTDLVQTPTSVTNPPFPDLDFTMLFESNLLDTSGCF